MDARVGAAASRGGGGASTSSSTLSDGVHASKALRQVCAGAISGCITKTSVAPLERLKVLRQTGGMRAASTGGAEAGAGAILKDILVKHGPAGLYKGNGANCLRVIPVYALKFSLNDTFKDAALSGRRLGAAEAGRGGAEASLTFGEKAVAGSLAGFVQIVTTYPLDLVRTRLQLAEMAGTAYKGIGHALHSIWRTEGGLALYKGLAPSLICGAPYVGLQMSFYDALKERAAPALGTGPWAMLGCGAVAGLAAQTACFPMDTVRHRIQADGANGTPRVYKGTADCVKQMLRKEGVGSFYRGWGLNVFRALPGAAIQFTAYDTAKRVLGAA